MGCKSRARVEEEGGVGIDASERTRKASRHRCQPPNLRDGGLMPRTADEPSGTPLFTQMSTRCQQDEYRDGARFALWNPHELLMRPKSPVKGSFVAMAVFKPNALPKLDAAKGHAYFLWHSKEDKVCPFRFAEDASTKLKDKGAAVELRTYEGGHGWKGDMYGAMRDGMKWLVEATEPKKK